VALTATAPAPSASASTTAETAGPPSALFRQEHLLRLIDPSSTSRASSLSLAARADSALELPASRCGRHAAAWFEHGGGLPLLLHALATAAALLVVQHARGARVAQP